MIWGTLVAQLVKNPLAMQATWVWSWVGKIPWRREWLTNQYSGLENSMGCIVHGSARWWNRRMSVHFLLQELQNCNSLLNNHWQENVGSHQKKRYPKSKGKGEAPARLYNGQNHIYNQTPYRPETLRGFKQNFVHTRTQRHKRDWTRPAFKCLRISCGGAGQQCLQGQGLWVQHTWTTQHVE